MTEKSKRLKQLLKVIEDKEKDLTDNERMNYQNLKILHIGMQSKLYKIMLTWDFGWNALQKNQYTDIKESLDADSDFYKQALKSWKNQKPVRGIPQVEEIVDIYEQWLIEMLHHDLQDAFHPMRIDPDKESLRRLITDYRDKLQYVYIDEDT